MDRSELKMSKIRLELVEIDDSGLQISGSGWELVGMDGSSITLFSITLLSITLNFSWS